MRRVAIITVSAALMAGCASSPDIEFSEDSHAQLVLHEIDRQPVNPRFRSALGSVGVAFEVAPSGEVIAQNYRGNSRGVQAAQRVLNRAAPFPRHDGSEPLRYHIRMDFD